MSAYDVTTDGRLQIQEVSSPSPVVVCLFVCFYRQKEDGDLEQTWHIWEIESEGGGGVVTEYYIHQIS